MSPGERQRKKRKEREKEGGEKKGCLLSLNYYFF
jgi:hypothetical protein